jgi:arabinogalactan oligomer / maltooligosaccharide transport system permease protein
MVNDIKPIGKLNSKIPALASFFIWGLGQIINKQYLKGVFFCIFQLILVLGEILTGNYFYTTFVVREDSGIFIHSIWGLITLGTTPRKMGIGGLSDGDHSINLLINGLIIGLTLLIFLCICIWNVKDAYITRKVFNDTGYLPSTKTYLKTIGDSIFHYIALLPAIILLTFFSLMPIIFAFLVAFTNYSKSFMPPTNLVSWVGFANFKNLATMSVWSKTFMGVFSWTIVWALVSTASCFCLGFFQAVMLNSKRIKFTKIWRSILILPWAMPLIITLLVFRSLFNGQFGPISQFLFDSGITSEKISWFADATKPNLARIVIILVNLWIGFPYSMALISGILTSISDEVYEAAKIDGASPTQEFWKITVPLVIVAIAPLLIMFFAGNFNNFTVLYFLTEGGPTNVNYQFAGSTDILITWIYKLTVDQQMFHMASVMSILIFIVVGSFSAWNYTKTNSFKEEY